jgi:transketolase
MRPGRLRTLSSGKDFVLLTSGICTEEGLRAAAALRGKGVEMAHYHVSTLKPFRHPEVVEAIAASRRGAITLENHSVVGGLGSIVAECMAEAGVGKPRRRLGLQDTFAHGSSRRYLMREYGLDAAALVGAVEDILGERLAIDGDSPALTEAYVPALHSSAKAESL